MPVVGIDDTDSRERGMCTTYVATRVANRLREAGVSLHRQLLVRCNPAVEHKTRGNAALALHAEGSSDDILSIAADVVAELAETADPKTNPGVVVSPEASEGAANSRDAVADFARRALREQLTIEEACELVDHLGYESRSWGNGRGRIGALAAIGAWAAFDEWTVEHIAYREPERWGSDRRVESERVLAAADRNYPAVWDTVDRTAEELVCVPHTPGPVLFGIRGETAWSVEAVADAILTGTSGEYGNDLTYRGGTDGGTESATGTEPATVRTTFLTNQGTDAHLSGATIDAVRDGRAYRVEGTVVDAPETRAGGHVHLTIGDVPAGPSPLDPDPDAEDLPCVAFEPTKRFRDRVRSLRIGDRITVCGEVSDGTCKLEKFALRDAIEVERVTPTCPSCERRMESAGAGQGYRCRDCDRSADEKAEVSIDRSLEPGWYEVPPFARRHVAKPLVRGGFDAPVHPER
jgi:tRNA(Ile2)-agmatinylcytidine synthase